MKAIAIYQYRRKQYTFSHLLPVFVIYLLLLLPAVFVVFFKDFNAPPDYLLARLAASCAVFTAPVVVFYKHLKLYLYLLAVWILLAPALIFLVIWLKVSLNFSLVALLMQTNGKELLEATRSYWLLCLLCTSGYLALYLLAVKRNTIAQLPFRKALALSAAALLMLGGYALAKRYKYRYGWTDVVEETYPLGLFSGLHQAHTFMEQNNLEASKNFSFHAQRADSLPGRKVFIFIIGESARYDRWAINGYDKPTSPQLSLRSNLLTFSNVTAGCNLTWMSVPQMITRAHPDGIDRQFKEKSILSAFNDAGFKTVWLSSQGDKELFWSGTITLHAKTADVSLFDFPPLPRPNLRSDYDERLLAPLDSILRADTSDLFFVLHTIGSHWTYPDRYPPGFEAFKPAGRAKDLNPFTAGGKEAINNAYDNSIRYADYIIDSVIRTVEKHNAVSAVTFLSDHGEDLFDARPGKMNFHLAPSPTTLHVPLFVWTSDAYRRSYGENVRTLAANRHKKVGPENTFYTLLHVANITYPGFDSTKSLADAAFQESAQRYYDDHAGKAFDYSRFPTSK